MEKATFRKNDIIYQCFSCIKIDGIFRNIKITKNMLKLIIFDLDDTLRHVGVESNSGYLCKETLTILQYLRKEGHILAVASHNLEASTIIKNFGIHHYFDIVIGECDSPATKMPLVNKILEHTKMDKKDIIFFDDLREITDDLKKNGIQTKLVNWAHGIRMEDISQCGL